MLFTLDRKEDGNIAVMISDDGDKVEVIPDMISGDISEGNVYTYSNGIYIYNEKETQTRKNKNRSKFNSLLKRAKNRK